MSVAQNKEIALRFATEGWGTIPHWKKVWDEVVDPNLIYHFCNLETIHGLNAAKEFEQSLFDGFPHLQRQIKDVVADEDKVVIRSTLKGKQTGTFLGMPPTHKLVQVSDLVLLKIFNAKIIEIWYELNQLAVMQQLGVA